jgi:hypothetical protein
VLQTAIGLVLWGLLIVAAMLKPDPSGLGTHRQLGLPPCSFAMLFGIRCPTCGMTTAWSNVMHGRPDAAVRASVSGTILAVVAALAGTWCLATAASGRWSFGSIRDVTTVWLVLAMVGLILLEWGLRLYVIPS